MEKQNEINVNQDVAVTPLGTSAPDEAWDWSRGTHNYAESADDGSYMYTDWLFTGYSGYDIKIHNGHSSTVEWEWRDKKANDTTIESGTVAPGASFYTRIDTISASDDYYLRFKAPCHVDGYVAHI